MIPSVISAQVRQGIEDFLRTTFPIHTRHFDGVIERLLEARAQHVFKGPYVSVKLPYTPGTGGRDVFPALQLAFQPYLHQQQAFQRLRGGAARSTLIATGTGSGKTECFLYPILDSCWQHRGEPGIKAIVVYPMNALATDQARRFASVIHHNPRLRETVRVGLYVGDREAHSGSMTMTADQVITNRDTMRLRPPDILLTNYKMLDYLMIRPADAPLWQHNRPDTLQYVVVDELHTFDGAQGTDLACLLRRLKARLQIPAGHLCCVGTSATLGGAEHAERLRDYAGQVFGEVFDADAIIRESVLQPQAFFGATPLDTGSRLPGPEQLEELRAEHDTDVTAYVARQAALWFDLPNTDVGSEAWRLALGRRLLAHPFFRQVIVVLSRRVSTLDDLAAELAQVLPGFGGSARAYRQHLLISLLALVSTALAPAPQGGKPRPFLQVRLQLWMRELRRMVCSVAAPPTMRFADDLTPEQSRSHLPLIHCRECGETGWLGAMREQDDHINADLQHIYDCFFTDQPTTQFLFPGGQPLAAAELQFGQTLCGQCLRVMTGTNVTACSACGSPDALVPVWVHNPRLQRRNRVVSSHNCPYCNGQDSLTIMGSQAASLISVGIAQLFASAFNDDRKLLAFSDAVQDAAHRAGFFGARTYRFNFRAALQQCVADLEAPVSLAELPQAFREHYRQRWAPDRYVSTLLPPDMAWLDDYEYLIAHGRLPDGSDLMQVLDRRIGWEIASEYAFRSRIGRTLEKTGGSAAGVDLGRLEQAIDRVLETVRNDIGGLRQLPRQRLLAFTNGFLTLLKTRGAVLLPPLEAYVKQFGGYYVLNQGANTLVMPRFGRRSRTPVFLTTRPGIRFDQLVARGTASTWYQDWAWRGLGDLCASIQDFALALYEPLLAGLVHAGVLDVRDVAADRVWGLRPQALLVQTEVWQYRCDICGHNVSAPAAEAPLWPQTPCLRLRCAGTYVQEPQREDYYGRLYATGYIERIVPAEHTALLERPVRERVERQFIGRQHPWEPNLLSCTPTLEMGIDIGDLSSAVLCSVPPTQASYLQRLGRTGRRDGNAFNLTVANGVPHDLYFYAQPTEMIAGAVEPPGCFLNASAVLERQFTAFCFDNWVQAGVEATAWPRKLGAVLSNLARPQREHLFPFTLLSYIERHRSRLFERFVGLFDGLPEAVVDRLRSFVEGHDGDRPSVRVAILQGLEAAAAELHSLRSRVRTLRQAIKRLAADPARDAGYEDELEQLEIERGAMASMARAMLDKDTYNFFTDEGLLPNYAFPEAGVQLRSVILRRRSQPDGRGRYRATALTYERPAVSAIHELAPSNQFYAEGRKVRIDQIDMRLAEVEAWRLCNACPHMELVASDSSAAAPCPRCGSVLWADDGQVRRLLKLRQVVATTTDRTSRIQDDSDQRQPVVFTKRMLVQAEARDIVSAYRLDTPELPFGYEYLHKADFREINFGPRNVSGDTMHIAGQSVPQTGFQVCRTCGKVAEAHHPEPTEHFQHAIGCPARRSGAARPVLDCLYLYREFSSEAIRMLLPVASFAGSEQRLQSFIAAVILGLEHTFHGNIDHLAATVQEEPMPDQASLAKKYLVLYDRVPGGTGYLKELAQSAQAMLDLFERALTVLRRCGCQDDTARDGCYRCVYAYRNSFDRPDISRRTAIASLAEIVHHRDRLVPTETVTRISQNSFLESELEAYFIEALQRQRFDGQPVQLRKDIVHHKTGWYCQVNGHGYAIEPQVELSEADGVPIPTRADFVIWPERQQHARPLAVYLDGFAHHADTGDGLSRVGDDLARRMGLVRSGRYHVWSLTWNDLESRFTNGAGGHFVPLLRAVGARQKKLIDSFDRDTGVGQLRDVHRLDSLALLVRWLAEPQQRAWQASAAIQMLVQMDRQGCDGDDIELQLEGLLGAGSPWIEALRPPAEASGLIKGELADTEDADACVELLTWVPTEAIRRRALEEVRVVCRLRDLGDVRRDPGFKKAWNGFVRLYNLLQFLPECLFVTEQGLQDAAYQPLEFVRACGTTVGPADADDTPCTAYAELVDSDVLAALRVLVAHGVRLPEPDSVPFELCGRRGNVMAQAELAWDEHRVALVYADDVPSQQAFAAAGWTVRQVEDLVARPADIVPMLQGGGLA